MPKSAGNYFAILVGNRSASPMITRT